MPSQRGRGGGVSILRKEEKKEGKKRKTKQFLDFSAERARLSMPLLARQTYSFDHPILSLSLLLIIASSDVETKRKRDWGREKGGEKTRVSLPFTHSPFLSLRPSHRGNKKESRDRKTSISKHTVGTSWISENWKSVSPWDSTTATRSTSFLPISIPPLRLESNGNPRQTSCEESGINVLLPLSISLSRYPLYRGTTTHSALRSAIFAFLDLVVIVRIGSDKESGFLSAWRRRRETTSSRGLKIGGENRETKDVCASFPRSMEFF